MEFLPAFFAALRAGRKTQTRRPIEPQPFAGLNDSDVVGLIGGLPPGHGWSLANVLTDAWASGFVDIPCPYGMPGDVVPVPGAGLVLTITDVRIEHLQAISDDDAKAEGLRWHSLYQEWGGLEVHPDATPEVPQWRWYEKPVEAFRHLWASIYGADSWQANPWVWVITFTAAEE